MKYPQLVSTRAVNAISDWLVSRLEQMGVEAPQIYSRLLLSLLQSSTQINDPIEFNNLETFFANRKGSNRRYPLCEPNTLKKINAVQCLREIVSSEQEIASIEVLVDELFEKLIAIEKQSTDVDDDHLVSALSINTVNLFSVRSKSYDYNKHHKAARENSIGTSGGGSFGARNTQNKTGTRAGSRSNAKEAFDAESDPKRRYFRAFPALSKEMEDSFRAFRKNTKSLTWPVDKSRISKPGMASKDSGMGLETKCNSKKQVDQIVTITRPNPHLPGHANINKNENIATVVKRKTRHRRNQGLSRRKNARKKSSFNGVRYRSSSPFWDTDFEGSWEMGRDLIQEFIVKQNNRNRSATEYATCTNEEQQKRLLLKEEEKKTEQFSENSHIMAKVRNCSSLIPPVDISFLCNVDDDDDDDALASVSGIAETSYCSMRRLYKRDVNQRSHEYMSEASVGEHFDFAQFEAKFDNSLEALWKNIPDVTADVNEGGGTDTHSVLSSSMVQLPSVPPVPFKGSLQSFWTNYYNHHFDSETIVQEPQSISENSDILSRSGFKDITNNSDYYSMPCNLEEFDKSASLDCHGPVNVFLQNSIWSDSSNGLCRTETDESLHKPVLDSQKANQLEAIKKKVDGTENCCSQESVFHLSPLIIDVKSKWSEGINAGPKSNVNMYSIHPTQHLLQVQLAGTSPSSILSTCLVDHAIHSSELGPGNSLTMTQLANVPATLTSTSSCSSYSQSTNYNWQTPFVGQNLQPDMQSWSSSNPKSLTDLYGSGDGTSDGKRVAGKSYMQPPNSEAVTLPNHCSSTSGFIEYARIKLSSAKILKHNTSAKADYATQSPHHYPSLQESKPQQYAVSKECYVADEDLLNSDLTHFRPIKPYEDGHSFYICSALDVIDYERSESGYLYWGSEKYLEYTRKDTFLAEEDTHAISSGGTPLYANSNCLENLFSSSADRQCGFVMKFRLKNSDAACQTEMKSIADKSEPSVVGQCQPRSMFSASLHPVPFQTTEIACSDALKALNKAVVAAAKVAAATRDSFDDIYWAPPITRNRMYSSKIKSLSDVDSCDEVDFHIESRNALEQWSMHEIGKKCELNNESNVARTHTLWGLCAACNDEFKSVPANRLLKDELQLEADEIMNDLKYMQDLYIGETAAAGSESEFDVDDTGVDTIQLIGAGKRSTSSESKDSSPIADLNDTIEKMKDQNLRDQAEENVFDKVNRLIADLLCRENDESTSNLSASENVEFIGDSGSCKDESNLWQQASEDFNPVDLLKCLNGQDSASALHTKDDQFLTKLSWEHNYLAEIWEKETPETESSTLLFNQCPKETSSDSSEHSEIVRRNFKNLLNSSSSSEYFTGDDCVPSSSEYKASNRKRRHSASQDVYMNLPTDNASNNNNDLHIADLNKFIIEDESCNKAELQRIISSLAAEPIHQDNNVQDSESMRKPKQTIITCNYWTTIDSTANTDLVQGSAFSCVLNKNSSILKHVTMVTRPLTR